MHLILLLLLNFIWIYNRIFSFGLQTIAKTTEVIDIQDGHPNHLLWQKIIGTERLSMDNWYV